MSGPTTVTNGDAVVRIDERGNVTLNGKVIGFDPSFVQPKRTLQYDISVIGAARVNRVLATIEKAWERHRATGLARTRRNRWLLTARIAVRLLQSAFILLWATAVGYVCDRFQVPPTWLSICLLVTLSLGVGLALDSAASWAEGKFR